MSKNLPDHNQKSAVAVREEKTLGFWQQNKIFQKSVETPAGAQPKGEFVFYDGPPFATGTPHFGHLLPTSIKDAFPRYQTMKGNRVERRWGWDCHGLPVENIVEKELNLKIKKDIEEYGIEKFNEAARASVTRYTHEWEKVIPRLGRWVDMENDYRTMDASYTESIWWIFKTLFDRGLIYEGYKSMHICPRCETTLANFEVNQGYKDVTDISVIVEFELVDEPGTHLLAWTTTPWTLPGNVALAVNPELIYVKIEKENQDGSGKVRFILAKDRLGEVFGDDLYAVLEEVTGADLVGQKYQPIFDYYASQADLENHTNGWQVYPADFVTTEEGTGIVHIAPAFGEDDMNLGRDHNLPFVQHVGMDGKFKLEVTDFAGLSVKPKENPQQTDIEIIKYLAHNNYLFAKKKITHSYPHCWRCDTPLLNYAASSWFVKVTDFKDRLLASNNQVNWIPDHIKEGRFGKWLEGARDWAISRSRFWGAPIPVWRCNECEDVKVIGSVTELSDLLPASRNGYLMMRHGQADHNVAGVLSGNPDNPHHLTDLGKDQVNQAVALLRDKKIDLVVSSPFVRTRETASLIAQGLGLSDAQVFFDDRLGEIQTGLDGQPVDQYHRLFASTLEKFTKTPPGGENLQNLKQRMMAVVTDLEQKYKDKNILIISHEYPLWMLDTGMRGLTDKDSVRIKEVRPEYISTGEVKDLPVVNWPKNSQGELDLHRPYIDEVIFSCACGGEYVRVPDVFDCWFESGAMPYGQAHYPFNRDKFDPDKGRGFPANFIAEGLDQTRGWFYSLIVLSTALFDQPAYQNVIVNGLILAEDGQKMSKRLKNYPDLSLTIDKYGADALRMYLLSSPAVHADDFSFSESGLGEMYRRNIVRLENVLSFYELYGSNTKINLVSFGPKDSLDRWIVSRLAELTTTIEKHMDSYEIDRAVRPIDDFIDDLSTWYVRRSRDRFKSSDPAEQTQALETTGYVLVQLAKVVAPFIPFIAEHIYQAVNLKDKKPSVHLEAWPQLPGVDHDLLGQMAEVRSLVEQTLSLRSQAGIKVRQPLASLSVKSETLGSDSDLIKLIADEVNVKQVKVNPSQDVSVKLDTNITPELAREGVIRELVRAVQGIRKDLNLSPDDRVIMSVSASLDDEKIVKDASAVLFEVAGVSEIKFAKIGEGKQVSIDNVELIISLTKI